MTVNLSTKEKSEVRCFVLGERSLDLIRGRWVREFGCEVVGAQAGVPVPLWRDTICVLVRYFIG
jgi:hypothetical protein